MSDAQNSTTSATVSVRQQLELKKRVLSTKQQRQHNFSSGSLAEATAVHYLTSKDYVVLATNVRYQLYEVDIIALDKAVDELVFCEVKYRQQQYAGHASEAVDYRKLSAMNIVAEHYVEQHKVTKDYRFDIITVIGNEIEHFENVTWS